MTAKPTPRGDTFLYMYNGHVEVTTLLDTTGNVAATYYYDAFGNILDQTGILSNNILYAGCQYDIETGLYYLNAGCTTRSPHGLCRKTHTRASTTIRSA